MDDPYLIIAMYENMTANVILSSQKLKAFSSKPGARNAYPLLPFLFNAVLETLNKAFR